MKKKGEIKSKDDRKIKVYRRTLIQEGNEETVVKINLGLNKRVGSEIFNPLNLDVLKTYNNNHSGQPCFSFHSLLFLLYCCHLYMLIVFVLFK